MPVITRFVLKERAYVICGRTEESWNVKKTPDMRFFYEPGDLAFTATRKGHPEICKIPFSSVGFWVEEPEVEAPAAASPSAPIAASPEPTIVKAVHGPVPRPR